MEQQFAQIWDSISAGLRPQVGPEAFQRWFEAVTLIHADETHLTLRVPNNIYQLWIETNYMALLQHAIIQVLGSPKKIQFEFRNAAGGSEKESQESSRRGTFTENIPRSRKKECREEQFSNVDQSDNNESTVNGMLVRNTFQTFVVGTGNDFAHAACLAVAQSPARTYNPLFIYGGVGLGKTHLMHAIGQHIYGKRKSSRVLYLSSEKFTNEFIDAIQNSSLVKFRKRYRQADVLLIDDIQFFGGKERSQEEFFHTFNTLFDGHKQIVMSSDRPPSEIANLEHRLVSRFEWGLTAELTPPDVETRLAILRKKAQALRVRLPDAVLEFLAERIRTNVRRLEGALMRVASFASLCGSELTTERIEHLLKDILQEEARRAVTIDQIQRCVAEHYDVRLADMTSKRRPKNIAYPRQIAMYLSRELTKASLSEIGEAFGGRDHGTVLHAHRLVRSQMEKEEKVRQTISMLDSQLHR